MPSTVEFVEPVVRRLEPDEEFVVTNFERHATHCPRCVDAVKTFDKGATLCDRGNQYAVDVNKYIYGMNNMAHSVVDRELGRSTLVQIGLGFDCVRRLLLALQFGLPLRHKEVPSTVVVDQRQNQNNRERQSSSSPAPPVISYDRTYPVAPRVSPSTPSHTELVVERVPHSNKPRHTRYPSRGSSTSRGSLYEEDAADRVETRIESPRRNRPIDYYR